MSNERIRLGVIGAGRIAQAAHLPALVKAANIELVAISDPSPTLSEGVSARYGIRGYTDTEALLNDDIDAVLVATPDRFHHALGTMALQAGKHVLMEKPLAATSEQAADLAALASASGLKLQTGAMKRHDPGLAFAKQHLPRIGRILSFVSWYRVMSELRPPTEATLFPEVVVDQQVRQVENTFKAERERYLLATHGAHLFDGLTFFGGPATWVSARVGNVGDDYSWHGLAGLEQSDGLVSFEISAAVHAEWDEGTDIYGEFGHIRTRSPFPFWKKASDVEVHIEAEGYSVSPHFGDTNAYKLQAEHFAAAILNDLPTNPTPDDGVAAVTWIEAVAESSTRGGAEVALDPVAVAAGR
jgi:predicted dehydrogenase